MKLKRNIIFQLILSIGLFLFSCSSPSKREKARHVFYVNSYHAGYGSSDDVMAGITQTLEGKNVVLKTFFMDSKRKSSEKEIKQTVEQALLEIKSFSPDLLIVSDDNAVKYLIAPHFNNAKIPVVFCGVNWSAEQYKLGKNITGMLEVLPIRECILEVRSNYPNIKKMSVLSENTLSEQNNKTLLDTLYQNLGLNVTYSLIDNFEDWKVNFLSINNSADLIYIPTNGAIKNWDEQEAKMLISENFKIPIITCDDFMMPYAVFGLTKVAKEQGQWAGTKALEILEGKAPAVIPYSKNKRTKAWLNVGNAEKIDFILNEQLKNDCTQL